MTFANPLVARLANEPVMVDVGAHARFEASLNGVLTHEHADALMSETADAGDGFWPAAGDWRAAYRPYHVSNGILQIPVRGALLNNFPWAIGGWVTGYEYIWRAFERGMNDDGVRGIALVIDSPGGYVAGNFDLVDRMFAFRGRKPIRAFASESAYSAAYSIFSVADHGVVARTGGVGSIGVVTGHLDVSGAMEKAGLRFTYIFDSEGKVDGNPYEVLSDEARDRIQARVTELYGIFVSTVARNRGMTEEAVRDVKSHCYPATQALSNGLADEIGSLDDAMSAFAGFLDDQSDNNGEDEMAEPATSAVDQAVHESAVAAARAEGHTAGGTEAKARITAILNSDQAKTRPNAALAAALDTDMSVEQATAFLGRIAEETKPGADTGKSFDEQMSTTANPNAGAGGNGNDGDEMTVEQRVKARRERAERMGLTGFAAPKN